MEDENQHHNNSEEGGEEQSFEELGLDPRLIRALLKKNIDKATPIQRAAIPLILQGKDIVARAKTGSGKTFAYLLPLLQKLLSDSGPKNKLAPHTFILVPTRELAQQVYTEVLSLIELCRLQLKVVQLTSSMTATELQAALAGPPDILVSTPACIQKCLSAGVLATNSINDSLSMLILDEADLLLSYGYEDDLKTLTTYVPRRCQKLLMSATSSTDVETLKKLLLHNPFILTLPEVGTTKDEIIPKSVQQFWVSCKARDKLLHILALLKLQLVQKKILIFTNCIDMGYRLRLFLEKFGIKSAILNAELPQNSRLHILEEFNAGLFDYLIATDDSQKREKDETDGGSHSSLMKSKKRAKQKLDSEFGVVRGIDFKNVHTVINFELPLHSVGYVHRIGRTGRGYSTGASISLVSPDEMGIFEEIKSLLGNNEGKDSGYIAPFPLLSKNAVEALRYRAEDVGKSITKVAVREARAADLRKEILNSEKLKAHFENNPKDRDLLKHDRDLSKKVPPSHLRDVPDYLVDSTTREASKIMKLARAAMGNNNNARSKGSRRKSKKSGDPLKSLSIEAPKRGRRGGMKRKSEDGDGGHNRRAKRSF